MRVMYILKYFSVALKLLLTYGGCCDIMYHSKHYGGYHHEAYQDYQDKESLHKERRLRRVPDLLSVRLQDQLRHC